METSAQSNSQQELQLFFIIGSAYSKVPVNIGRRQNEDNQLWIVIVLWAENVVGTKKVGKLKTTLGTVKSRDVSLSYCFVFVLIFIQSSQIAVIGPLKQL